MSTRIRNFCKDEAVLCIAALAALATMFLIPPDGAYLAYIDLRVLCLLLCLMAVVEGFQSCSAFRFLAFYLLKHSAGGRVLGFILVMLPFFSAMLVTNDVALLTFVPFTLLLLERIDCRRAAVPLLVLQTVAANLGSMATPVGNPQNLFLYSAYDLSAGEFFSAVLPLTVLSFIVLAAASLFVLPREIPNADMEAPRIRSPRKLAVYAVLFFLCLLTVFRILPYGLMTLIVLAAIFCIQREMLLGLDFALLATFVCFFIVSGNLGRVEAVSVFLQQLLGRSTLLTAAATSQVISNVPAAVLLATFTDRWRELLQGVNIGGLGTPVASLASLITLKLYLRWPGARAGRFLLVFSLANFALLALLLLAALIL
ncbi:MAG: anion permease [Oscillospiraceae bacterium]|nr:anion permease [Oscillospiraceae bacterium]